MQPFAAIAILLTLSALFSFVNERYIRLPTTVGVMLIALLMSLGLIALNAMGVGVERFSRPFVEHIDLNKALLQWMLGFLLFAGALQIDLNELLRQGRGIALLATVGTVLSMLLCGGLALAVCRLLHIELPVIYCFLFGALISPTDPVAVIALMKTTSVPKGMQVLVTGESLFNDGVGVALFLTLLSLATQSSVITPVGVAWLFCRQTLGGIVLGLAAGSFVYQLIKRVDNFHVETLLTLALAMGGYALGDALHTSAPIAAVVSGLLIGSRGKRSGMSPVSRERLDLFWELIDEILNAVLFVIIGLELLHTPFNYYYALASLLLIPGVLLARWLSVMAIVKSLAARHLFTRLTVPLLTWGGLRGGLAVAMALSLPAGQYRNAIVAITYGIVLFSILVQGTTISRVIRRYRPI